MQAKREMIWNTITMAGIAAWLGYMAFGTGWHAALFGFLTFVAHAVGNRISQELAATRAALTQANPSGSSRES
jgi:hypothetical protein